MCVPAAEAQTGLDPYLGLVSVNITSVPRRGRGEEVIFAPAAVKPAIKAVWKESIDVGNWCVGQFSFYMLPGIVPINTRVSGRNLCT